ncbi:MAG: hypothetical protein MI923_26730, partial [Phycisphaerales bacterium]|nr:hypothetical protein [Phycisphaerales bacterium]
INRIGHQGLFFDRFDGGIHDPVLAPGAAGLYYNRNRMYSPSMGRFIQRDPNETAMPALTALASNGDAMFILLGGFDGRGLYGDGMNLYEYAGSNPLNVRDPLGLYDDFDEVMSDLTGQRVATLGYINSASGWALIAMNTTVDLIGGILGISDLYELGKNAMNGEMDVWDFVTAATLVAGPASRVGVAVFKAFKWGRKFAKHGRLSSTSKMFGRYCKRSFVAGTWISTPEGGKPIEDLRVGDEVFSVDEHDPCGPPKVGRVTQLFRRIAPAILWVELACGTALGTTPNHEVWTHQHGWIEASLLSPGDTFLDENDDPVTVKEIWIDPTPTPVYNFEVEGTATYYAQGVWVHNCPMGRKLFGLDYEAFVRNTLGVGNAFRKGGREFDGRLGQLWIEMKTSRKGWSDWMQRKNQLGSQAKIARENGRQFGLFTPDPIPSEFAAWLQRKGIIHRIVSP